MTKDNGICALEGCNNPLNRGKYYCSRECSNRAKAGLTAKKTEEKKAQPDIQVIRTGLIPIEMERALQTHMGANRANIVLREIQSQLAIRAAEADIRSLRSSLKPPTNAQIEIDSEMGYYSRLLGSQYWSDFRRKSAIGLEDIELMQRCGIMIFASRLKKSSIVTSLSNPRYWSVKSPNRKLQAVATANLVQLFQRHAHDILLALDYGSVFMSKQWAQKTAEELGVEEKGVGKDTKWWIVDKLHTAHPESVTEVVRKKSNMEFIGFTHERKYLQPQEVLVKAPQAFVISYNSKFGNIWGQSIYEPVYDYWYWYEVVMRSFMRYLERMGIPVAVCKAPSKGTVKRPDGTIVNSSEWAMLVAGAAGHSSAVYLPSDVDLQTGQPLWSLDYLSADQQGVQFVEALQMLGTWILRGMIVGDRSATQDSAVGSYAAALVHSGYTELDNDLIYKSLVGQINRWLMPDFGRYNVDPNNPPPIVLKTEGLDPREKDRIMKLVATAGNQKLGSGSPFDILDWETMFNAVDLPTLTEEQRKEMIEKQTDEALEKQKKFNELQQETGEPAAKNPFGGQKPQPKPGTEPGEVAKPGQKLYEAFTSGAPLLLSRDEAVDILRPHMQESITLFNPFHDELGRFASSPTGGVLANYMTPVKSTVFRNSFIKEGTKTEWPSETGSRRKVIFNNGFKDEDMKRIRGEIDKQEKFLKDNFRGFKATAPISIDNYRWPVSMLIGGYYDPEEHQISLSKKYTKHMGKTGFWRRGQALHHAQVSVHEQIHAAALGKGFSDSRGRTGIEAATELTTLRVANKMYGRHNNKSGYYSIVKSLGNYMWKENRGNADAAWSQIGHITRGKTGDSYDHVFQDPRNQTGIGWWRLVTAGGRRQGDIQLQIEDEMDTGEIDLVGFEVWALIGQGKWDEAMAKAQASGDKQLIGAVVETGILHGVWFDFDLDDSSEPRGMTRKLAEVWNNMMQLFNPSHDEEDEL